MGVKSDKPALISAKAMKAHARKYFTDHPKAYWIYTCGWFAINEGHGVISIARYTTGFNLNKPEDADGG